MIDSVFDRVFDRVFDCPRQRGAAIITALLVVAIVALIAGALLAQQSQALTRTESVVGRAQSRAYADTAAQWARGVLFDDAKQGGIDYLGEPWAQGIAALPVENATLSGTLTDEAGRFNLNNLVRDGRASAPDVKLFRALLTNLALPPDLAGAVVDWIDADTETTTPGGAEDLYYMALPSPYRAANRPLVMVDELLRVRGIDAKTLARLRPFVTALPVVTRINLNTAPEEVIAAALPLLPEADRRKLVAERIARPFKDVADIKRRYPAAADLANTDLDVKSYWFSALVGVSAGAGAGAGAVQTRTLTLLRRDQGKWPVIIWQVPL